MPKLKITLSGENFERALDKPVLVAGRLPENDLPLTVKEASRQHFRIGRLKEGGWGIQDLNSTNGTLVNGEKVQLVKLKHKDQIQIGPECTIVFWDPLPPPPSGPPKPIVLKSRRDRLREQEEEERRKRREARRQQAAAAPPAEPVEEVVEEVAEVPGEDTVETPAPPDAVEITDEAKLDELMRDMEAFDHMLAVGQPEVRFGPYTIQKRLSAGGMGVVFKARHRRRKLDVALKILRTDMVDETNIARFQQEAWAISAFDHPNIVKVHDLAKQGGMHFLATDYVAGHDLLAAGFKRELTFWQTMEIAYKLADVLKLVHARNIWHRDIKPQNVLMDPDGEIKLIDFGIATVEREQTDATKTAEGLIMGTPAFLSPEQAARGKMGAIDGRADLYSLGALMYFLLTGRRPFTGKSPLEILRKNMTQMPQHPHQAEELAPPGLCDICWKLIQKNPDDRYQSAAELQDALARWRRTPDGRTEHERHRKILKLRERKAKLKARKS